MRPTLSRVFVPVALAAALLAGCSSTVTGSAAPEGGSPSAPGGVVEAQEQAEDIIEGGAPQESLDACALLPAAEVEALVGPGVDAVAGDAVQGSSCTWENEDTYHSVTVEIGQPGTAAGGQLPPWEPVLGEERTVGDGMRVINGGIEFVAGDRDCLVQVVTEDLGGDDDVAKGVEFAEVIRGKL
jgi:hypothetical protein